MIHETTPDFWAAYNALPPEVQELADKNYQLLLGNPSHPSLQLKQAGEYWSVRVGMHYRAIAVREDNLFSWFWIGTHAEYDKLLA